MTMPEPTGEYAKVPPGWPPQTWGAHLARIEFMEAMGQHYSFTDPKRHVRMFRKRLLEDERRRIVALLRELKASNGEIELAICRGE